MENNSILIEKILSSIIYDVCIDNGLSVYNKTFYKIICRNSEWQGIFNNAYVVIQYCEISNTYDHYLMISIDGNQHKVAMASSNFSLIEEGV